MQTRANEGELIAAVEARTGLPTLVVASCWRGEHAVDLDEDAARVFFDVLGETLAGAGAEATKIALVLAGRGGFPVFADAVVRSLSTLGLGYDVYVPCPVQGAYSLLCLGAEQIVVHPFGGVGAYDVGPLVEPAWPARVSMVELIDAHAEGPEERKAALRTANARHLQRSARALAGRLVATTRGRRERRVDVASLGVEALADDLALGVEELRALGHAARVTRADEQAALWELYEHVERLLGLRAAPARRFVPSVQWPDEVEFEPATSVPAALIASTARRAVFELDTGRPDPDTPRLHGFWTE